MCIMHAVFLKTSYFSSWIIRRLILIPFIYPSETNLGESKDIEGLVSKLHVLLVIDGGHRQLALRDKPVVFDVIAQETLRLQVRYLVKQTSDKSEHWYLSALLRMYLVGHEVIEGVIAAFKGLLVGEPRFLEEIHHHVSSREFSGLRELECVRIRDTLEGTWLK